MAKKNITPSGNVGAAEFFSSIEKHVRTNNPRLTTGEIQQKAGLKVVEQMKSMGIINDPTHVAQVMGSLSEGVQKVVTANLSSPAKSESSSTNETNGAESSVPTSMAEPSPPSTSSTSNKPSTEEDVSPDTKQEKENLDERKQLIALEEKQRKLFHENMKEMGIQSKIMADRSNNALEHLNKLSLTETENISNMSEGSQKILEQIRDLLKAARSSGLEEMSNILKKLEYLKAYGQEQAKLVGDVTGQKVIGEAARTTRGALTKQPMPGLASKLATHYGEELKSTARGIYQDVVPAGFRIIAEHIGGKLFNRQAREEHQQDLQAQYNAQQDIINRVRSQEGREDNEPTPKSFRNIGPRIVSKIGGLSGIQSKSPAAQNELKTLTVGTLIVSGNLVTNDSSKEDKENALLNAESDKHNKIRPQTGEKGGGLLGGLASMLESVFSPFKSLFGTLGSVLGTLGGALGGLLPLLGKGSLLAGAGIAGYEVGKHIVNPLLNAAATKITGQENTLGTALAGIFEPSKKDTTTITKDDAQRLFDQHMTEQKGILTKGQIEFAKKYGVDTSKATQAIDGFDPTIAAKATQTSDRVGAPKGVAPPDKAIATRTNMVDAVSKANETSKDIRTAKPNVIINNVGNNGKSDSGTGLGISMGSSRNQEPAFQRYLLQVYPGL